MLTCEWVCLKIRSSPKITIVMGNVMINHGVFSIFFVSTLHPTQSRMQHMLHHFHKNTMGTLPKIQGEFDGNYPATFISHSSKPAVSPRFRGACVVSQGPPWRHWGEWCSAAILQLPPLAGPGVERVESIWVAGSRLRDSSNGYIYFTSWIYTLRPTGLVPVFLTSDHEMA